MISNIIPVGAAAAEAAGDLPEASLLAEEEAALGSVSYPRRREFTIGRSCARVALLEIGIAPAPILRGASREPLWPRGVVGSLTHCPGYCAVAVARESAILTIGIDAEINDRLPPRVLEHVALDQERQWLRSSPSMEICWDRALFSAKESVFKAWFPLTGKWLGFEDALVTIDPKHGRFSARLLVEGPMIGDNAVTQFEGRYRVEQGRILTAVVMQRCRREGGPAAAVCCLERRT
jgi:4'-phosphopantetheinyl transferase EntD